VIVDYKEMIAYSDICFLLYEPAEVLLHTAEAMYHCMQSFPAISQQTVSNHLPIGNNVSDIPHYAQGSHHDSTTRCMLAHMA